MKAWIKGVIFAIVLLLLIAAWVVYFHNDLVAAPLAGAPGLQKIIKLMGQKKETVAEEDEDPDTTKNEIPVHTAQITARTMHRYIEGIGTITPRPARAGQMAGSANIVSPVAGVVAKVNCQMGQEVHAGDTLIQLDDRLAKSAEDQAQAALRQAQASLAALRATPRPEQVNIDQLAVDKAKEAVDFAQKHYDSLKELAADQGASGRSVQEAAQALSAAKNDQAVAEKQLALLKASPTPEDLNQEQAKVAQAQAALEAARTQRQLLTIAAPIDGAIAQVNVNPGESVDMARTLVQIVALDRQMVDLDVPADQMPANILGLPVEVLPSSAAWSGDTSRIVTGKVAMVSPQVDAHNGTVMVGVDLPALSQDGSLKPGLAVRVRITAAEDKDALVIPRAGVITDENGDNVIALVEGNQATHKTVKIGPEEEGMIEISADGIKAGDTVVTEGAFGLPQATKVKVVN